MENLSGEAATAGIAKYNNREVFHYSNFMYRQKIVAIGTLLILVVGAKAQTADYNKRIKKIHHNINAYLYDASQELYYETTDSAHNPNPHSWLWPLCALIQATNEMENLEPQKEYMAPVVKAIDQYYSDVEPAPGYQDYVLKERLSSRFYDDNQWIAIAYLDAYNRNKKPEFLAAAKMIYTFMMTGYDEVSGGGIYWKEGNKKSKNTCSNGPGILVALQLYKATNEPEYLKTALLLYEWTNKHLQSPEGIYYDNIKLPSMEISRAFYTYNTGTMLQSAALLYSITGEKKYLKEAQRIAAAGKQHFYKEHTLPGDYWFNAVMFRGYIELYTIDHNEEWIQFFRDDAERIWNNERDAKDLLGRKDYKELKDQAAMLEVYARLQQLKIND